MVLEVVSIDSLLSKVEMACMLCEDQLRFCPWQMRQDLKLRMDTFGNNS